MMINETNNDLNYHHFFCNQIMYKLNMHERSHKQLFWEISDDNDDDSDADDDEDDELFLMNS